MLQLWQRTNWHWYQKLEQRWGAHDLVTVAWSESHPSTLHALTSDGTHHRVTLATHTDVSFLGSVAVIEGDRVLVTPLRHGVLPPPLAAARVQLPAAANCVAWAQHHGCEVRSFWLLF